MARIVAYSHASTAGTFWIRLERSGFWQPVWHDEALGEYNTAQQALDDLAGGTCDWPSCGNPEDFGLSDDLADWTPHFAS